MDEIAELHRAALIRNRLLMAKTLQKELIAAAERVSRLSEPGTPERFFTLTEVVRESGFSGRQIVDAIRELKKKKRTATKSRKR